VALPNWETATETDNDYFDLEYSTDGETFNVLTRVEGSGTANRVNQYVYEHESPLGEMNYYRLKQVDNDGAFAYSDVVELCGKNLTNKAKVYPNPSHDVIN
jgi:hypothetical protein